MAEVSSHSELPESATLEGEAKSRTLTANGDLSSLPLPVGISAVSPVNWSEHKHLHLEITVYFHFSSFRRKSITFLQEMLAAAS